MFKDLKALCTDRERFGDFQKTMSFYSCGLDKVISGFGLMIIKSMADFGGGGRCVPPPGNRFLFLWV